MTREALGFTAPAARSATAGGYRSFAARLVEGDLISDPWLDGRPRFADRPLVLPWAHHQALVQAAERVGAVYDQVVRLCASDEALCRRYFDFTPWQRRMWLRSAPLWHGIARADVFFTEDGPAVCELNCDTPSGEAEAVVLGDLSRSGRGDLLDPNRDLEPRFCRLIERMAGRRFAEAAGGPLCVGIVYPTELTEDLSMVALYRRWIEKRGGRVVLGSPYNLAPASGGGVALFGRRLDLVVRHYKTDWLGERLPVRDDEPPCADAAALRGPLSLLLCPSAPPVLNPLPSIAAQNKRSMALMWEEQGRFPGWARAVIRRHVPLTLRLEALPRERLRRDKDRWVLKSDYGCEGAEVVVGAESTPAEWDDALGHALPRRFVAQRHFAALRDGDGCQHNHGVFLVAGAAAGLFTRVQRGRTDRGAVTRATLVQAG